MSTDQLISIIPSDIFFPQTYISAAVRFTASIVNNSDKTLRYRWCRFGSVEEENQALKEIDIFDPGQRTKIEQLLDFNSPNFSADPPFGEVWPHRTQIIVFEFIPDTAKPYDICAYLLDDITDTRHKVTLSGSGLPPDAQFSIDTINIGHVTLDSVCEYKVELFNRGKVLVDYDVDTRPRNGLIFKFNPPKGSITVGDSQVINIKFIASNVGQFNEVFTFNVRGATKFCPSLTFYGKVVGPDLVISSRYINFGDVSYGFLYKSSFDIENKSEIPFDYILRFQQNTSFSPREFNVNPSNGTIAKFSKETINIEFVPISVQTYNLKLLLDILKVGKEVEAIKISAVCLSPILTIKGGSIDFGQIFIGKSYISKLTLQDGTDFPAKYEFSLPEQTSISQALLTVSKPRGVIAAHQNLEVDISITSQVLGPIKMDGYVRIFGNDNPMIPFSINAVSTGPNITINPMSIGFGSISVLADITKKITITNDSLIPAIFDARINSEYNVFRVEPNGGEIAPKESIIMNAIANLDDTLNFSGKIQIHFKNLNPLFVDLYATGIGTPVKASINMEKVDFGYILNEQSNSIVFTMTNHGRRSQEIRWSISKAKIDERALPSYQFKIVPEQQVLNSHQTAEFKFVASCSIPCEFTQPLLCNATLGRQRVELFSPTVVGTVIKPLLSFSKNVIEFTHKHDYVTEESLSQNEKKQSPSSSLLPSQSVMLAATNLVQLPLKVAIDCYEPFTVTPPSFVIEPNSVQELKVDMDASFKNDFISEIINRKVAFCFANHPQKLFVNFKANFIFPNLSFSPGTILSFGNLLLNTEQTKEVRITACSESPVECTWQLVTDDKNCDICRIFDVFPTRGIIQAGETESVHFSFFAYGGGSGRSAKYNANAICHIAGGPDYVVQLSGAAAAINYKVEPTELNLGYHAYNETLIQEIVVQNLSDVSITFSTKIPKSCKFSHFSIYPTDGTINVGGSATLTVTVISGLPKEYQESFVVQIGHFDEIKIPVTLISHFPHIRLNLPRDLENDPAASHEANDGEQEKTPEEYSDIEQKIMITRLSDRYITLTEAKPARRRHGQTVDFFNGYILAHYFFDLGEITIGEIREFEYELLSLTPFPISIRAYDSILSETGFSLDPSAVSQIPAREQLTMKVVFDTARRSTQQIGDVNLEVIFEMGEDLGFIVVIKANLTLPSLKFSKQHFDFGEIIVGQNKTVTLQLQNMTSVPCEFSFGEPMPLNAPLRPVGMTKKKNQNQLTGGKTSSLLSKSGGKKDNNEENKEEENEQKPPQIFHANPDAGILRPATFQNIELSFVPTNGESYSMQLPVTIKHNSQPRFVTVCGKGVQLKVEFDPPSLFVPAIQPFSEPSQVEVQLINPLNYPIEVFSYQFDFNLFVEHFQKKEEPVIVNNVTFTQQASVSKFSICVIVIGPQHSGCTTISQIASNHLNKAPIIKLSDLWSSLMQNPESAAADYTAQFFNRISLPDCSDGFVVDGLDILKEPSETDQFLLTCLKQKNCIEDALLHPMQAIPHAVPTAAEMALKFIIAALDGHYLFIVGIKTTPEIINQRLEKEKNEERKQKQQKSKEEVSMLFNMSEAEYELLDEEKKEEVDRKRKALRRHLVKESESSQSKEDQKSKRQHRSKSRHEDSGKSDSQQSSDKKGSESTNPTPAKRRTKAVIPSDPYELSCLKFNLLFGSIVNSVSESCDNFQSLDPLTLVQEKPTFENAIQQHNALLLDSEIPYEEIDSLLVKFIPKLELLIEASFTNLIPAERVEIIDNGTPPQTKYEDSPPYFSVVNTEPVGELPDFDAKPIQVRGRSSSRRGRGATRGGKGGKKNPSRTFNFDTNKLTPKWRIEPNSRRSIFIKFDPTMIGNYKSDLLFGISRCLSDMHHLPVSGVCSYPNIDRNPKTIFTKKVNRCDSKTELAYAIDINEFVFGSVLIAKDKLARGVSPAYHEPLHFTNTSMFPVEITLVFKNTTGKVAWTTEPTILAIQPNETADAFVGCHPTTTEVSKTTLVALVKDHPDPLFLNFSVEGCVPSVDLSSAALEFDKLLLHQTRILTLELKNTSKLPSFWRLKKTNELGSSITFNETEGLIMPRGSFCIKVTFTSAKPISIKKVITFEILDKEKTRTFHSQQININAEAFDVLIDYQYPKGMDHLQFGSLKVLQTRQIQCMLKNKGKFPINFKVTHDSASIQNLIQVQPTEGTLTPTDKPLSLNFTFKSNKVLNFTTAKGLTLTITDPLTNTTTCKLPVPFSVETVYSQFTLSPPKRINFGPVSVNTTATKQISISNDGKFAFDFDISGKIDDPPPQTNVTNRKKGSAPPPKARGKKGTTHIQIGNYTVTPSSGSLQPGGSQVIDLEFIGPTPGDFKANVYFKITDSDPTSGETSVQLITNSIVPGILSNDYEKILPGTHLCLRYDLQRSNKTAFLEDEMILHFEPLILQQKAQVSVAMINPFPVPCSVDIAVKPKTKISNNNFPFDISDKFVSLDPNSSKQITLSFNPIICDNFTAAFEATVRGGAGESKTMKFGVEGIGTLPAVSIDGGMDKGKGNTFICNLGRTLLGFTKEKIIRILNDGVIDATISVTIKPNLDFQYPNPESLKEILISAGNAYNLTLLFKPDKPRRAQLDMSISVNENAKAGIAMSLIGEGSSEDVIFDGLSNDDNDLNFKDCIVGRQQQNVFTMRNVGINDVRFVWSTQHDINFVPRIGHLRTNQTKTIVVSFFADHPLKQAVTKVTCQIQKIELTDRNSPDWDDSMKLVIFVSKKSLNPEQQEKKEISPDKEIRTNSRKRGRKANDSHEKELQQQQLLQQQQQQQQQQIKEPDELVRVTEVKPEPAFTIIPGKGKEIPLKVTMVADVIKYQIDTTEIAFSPTMMYQHRKSEVKLTNTSQIRFEYNWRVAKFNSLRTEYSKNRPSPFTVMPISGYIEPGQTTTLRVQFCPEEVDDFTAQLCCDIPFLTQMEPPVIDVSGLSRRPLCHFNVELSDYINRRHPDYTNKLPDDIRVIEMFSKGINQKTIKKFELINPTSAPYEMEWVFMGEGSTPIFCETPSGLISSGKRSSVSFGYLPVSVKTIESLWEFQIPEHNVRVNFLFVGRIMP